jgi:hypothetical protein
MDPRKIAGIFDDDGYKISEETIKMQPLCLTCIKYNSDEFEEELLCNLNRNDQADEKEFKCGHMINYNLYGISENIITSEKLTSEITKPLY